MTLFFLQYFLTSDSIFKVSMEVNALLKEVMTEVEVFSQVIILVVKYIGKSRVRTQSALEVVPVEVF